MPENDNQYWYNSSTGAVEKGRVSPGVDRVGPFETAEDAANAPELLKARSRAWAEEEAREDSWDAPQGTEDDSR